MPTLLACGGGGALSPGAGDDPGTGTSTLGVDAEVTARPIATNARAAEDFVTEFQVRVTKNGNQVTSGTVTVTSAVGEVALTYNDGNNRWSGTQASYSEVYELSVVAGADTVDAVRVDGPALHTFSAPLPGATLDSLVANEIRWDRGEAADVATIDTDRIDQLTIADTGTFSLPAGSLKDNSQNAEQDRIRLERTQRVTPAGAVAGSVMRVSVRNEIEVLVQPTGL
ncbi:MAG: hypothetical protein R3B06_09325 [Kofleriaceae bacterium]